MSVTGVNERLAALTAAGTSVWLDQIRRGMIEDGELARMVDEDSLRGVTSNPAIFALGGSAATAAPYDPKPLAIGAQAPDFRLPGVDGKTYSLADFGDSPWMAYTFDSGPLPNDVTHAVKLFGSYNWNLGWSAGMAFNYASGRPLTELGAIPYYGSQERLLSPRGAPLSATCSNGRSASRSASSHGLAMVADEQMICGSEP